MTYRLREKPCLNPNCKKKCKERYTEQDSVWQDRMYCGHRCSAIMRRAVENPTHKICTRSTCKKAGELQPLDAFGIDRRNKSYGRAGACKECINAHIEKITPISIEEKVGIFESYEKGATPAAIANKLGRPENSITLVLREGPQFSRPQFMGFMQFGAEQVAAKRKRKEEAEKRRAKMSGAA